MTDLLPAFSPDYATARRRFREAATRLGWRLEAYPLSATGPQGEELTIDVGSSPGEASDNALVISSGVHGVEGFFGSAVQLAALQRWAEAAAPEFRCVFLHGLNPHGFAWLRRNDEKNVDLNRNFLLPGEEFRGAPAGYAKLDPFLNPRRPPSPWEPFSLKASWLIARRGMAALKQTIAAGQYDFPRGLFFGGADPSPLQTLLSDTLFPRLLRGVQRTVHLDFHTGLGPWGNCKLLIDYPLTDVQREWLRRWFGEGSFEEGDSRMIAYNAAGGFGRWCVARRLTPQYLFACAEFGTYHPLQVLAGLRAENQTHHWAPPVDPQADRGKQRLKELFCPADPGWRRRVLQGGLELVQRVESGFAAEPRA